MGPPSEADIAHWRDQAQRLAMRSSCTRDQVGALLIDPVRREVIAEGRNGTRRGGPPLCGGEACDRDRLCIPSGERSEIGCVHAEANLIANAAYRGLRTVGTWVVVTREPCGTCAHLLASCGIARVIAPEDP